LIGISDESAEKDGTSSEELFLDDDDYLRVHLPGYMQRSNLLSADLHLQIKSKALIKSATAHATIASTLKLSNSNPSTSPLIPYVKPRLQPPPSANSSLMWYPIKLDNGFTTIRPPGHHAEPGLAGGYCVINNIAVSAAYARAKLDAEKILIVDWDVHHGNGTQRCFYNDPNVLYFSVHRYHGGNFFPFLQQGGPASVGNGTGKGFNMNVGWNDKKMGDDEYLVVWEKLLMPVAKEFNPDLVLVSAGFDAAGGDMGECDVLNKRISITNQRHYRSYTWQQLLHNDLPKESCTAHLTDLCSPCISSAPFFSVHQILIQRAIHPYHLHL
jgi:histone deacetylase 6